MEQIQNIKVVGLGYCNYETLEDRNNHVVYCRNGSWKIKGDKTAYDEDGVYCETETETEDEEDV